MNWSILNTLKFGRTFERIDLRYSLNTFIIWKSYEKGVSLSKYDNYHREFSMCISRHKWLLQRQNKEWEVTLRRTIPVVNQDQHAQSIAQYMCSIVCSEQMKLHWDSKLWSALHEMWRDLWSLFWRISQIFVNFIIIVMCLCVNVWANIPWHVCAYWKISVWTIL